VNRERGHKRLKMKKKWGGEKKIKVHHERILLARIRKKVKEKKASLIGTIRGRREKRRGERNHIGRSRRNSHVVR